MATAPAVDTSRPQTLYDHFIDALLDDITGASAFKQFVIGAGLGWVTGKVAEKAGNLAAAGVVGCVILFQIGVYNELIPLNLTGVDRDLVRAQRKVIRQRVTTTVHNATNNPQAEHPSVGKIRGFYEENFFIAAGFPAGLLLSYYL